MKIYIFIFIFSFLLSGCDNQTTIEQSPPRLPYIVVKEYDVPIKTEWPGRIVPYSLSEVRPQVDGIILERLFEEGAEIEKGQPLYHIDADVYHIERNSAKAALDEELAKLTLLARQESRFARLARADAVSKSDLDIIVAEHRQAKARVARAKADLERAELNLEHTTVRAHASGRIGPSDAAPGSLVIANQELPLATIQRIDKVYADLSMPGGEDLRRMQKQILTADRAKALFPRIYLIVENGEPYAHCNRKENIPVYGKFLFTDISVAEDTGNVILRVVFENPDRLLLPGMYVKGVIEEGIEKVILAPQKCVFSNVPGRHSVFVLKPQPGKEEFLLEERKVKIGRPFENALVISGGLRPGELVLVDGLQRARAGEIVQGFEENDFMSPPERDSAFPSE